MDTTRAHFLVMVGEVCGGARLAGMSVEIITRDGQLHTGVPDPRHRGDGGVQELHDTGLGVDLMVGEETVRLDAVVELRIRSPKP